MDTNPSASRDPRRRPPLQSTLSQHEAQQHSPTRGRQPPVASSSYDASGDLFIHGIGDLVQKAVVAAVKTNEKDKIQKKRESTNDLLHKAKIHPSFPSTFEFYQQYQDQERTSLAARDDEIKKHGADLQRCMDELKSKWAVSANYRASTSDETVSQLQKDLQEANDQISNLRCELKEMSSKANMNNLDIKSLQASQGVQKNSVGEHTVSMALMKKEISDSLTRLKVLEDRPIQPVDGTPDTKRKMDEVSLKVKDLEQKIGGVSGEVGKISSSYQRINELRDQVKQSLKSQDQKLERMSNSQANIPVNNQAPNSGLNDKVELLSKRLNGLMDIQQYKDELVLDQMEELRGKYSTSSSDMDQVKQKLEEFGENCSTRSSDMDQIKQKLEYFEQLQQRLGIAFNDVLSKIPKEPVDAKLDGLVAEVRKWQAQLDSLNVAVLSLQTRYNNMTTEPIVQHMVGAMTEMYPSVDRILNELSAHKQTLDEVLPVLQHKIGQIETQANQSNVSSEELESLKSKQNELTSSIGDLLQRYQWLSQEEFLRMQTTLIALEEQQSNTDSAIQQKQTADQEFLQEVQREGQSLNKRLTDLSDALERLDSEYNQDKQDHTTALSDQDMDALRQRIMTLEQSTKDGYEELKEQFDRLRRTTQPPESPSRQPPRPDLVQDASLGMRIKRRRSESADERSPARSNSPRSPDSTTSPPILSAEDRRKKRKKKKKRLEGRSRFQDQNLIQVDD